MRRLALLTSLLFTALSLTGADQKAKQQIDLERIAASDPRIEFVARSICRARGLDPDHDDLPYPGPLWERFILEARDLLAADDAAEEWRNRHPGRLGPPD
jgi:hypothetical protein